MTKPKAMAIAVAASATATVFQKMCAYRGRSVKLPRP